MMLSGRVAIGLGQESGQVRALLDERRRSAVCLVAFPWAVDDHIGDHSTGTRAHHDHPRRQVHRLEDAVGHEYHRQVALEPELAQVAIELVAGELVQGAEGSSISSRLGSVANARAMEARICIPPESSRG